MKKSESVLSVIIHSLMSKIPLNENYFNLTYTKYETNKYTSFANSNTDSPIALTQNNVI